MNAMTSTELASARISRSLFPKRSPMRPQTGAHIALTAGVTPSVRPLHNATSATSVTPSSWTYLARNGITIVKPVKPTNEAAVTAT